MTSEQRATEYSETDCFELYCANGGKIAAMERFIADLPPEKRLGYPSRATLYRYEDDFQWHERYAKIREGVKQDLKGDIGMNVSHINQLSALVMAGTTKRLHQAYEAGNWDAFTPRLLDTVWKMQRVERGLATNVPYEHQRQDESSSDNAYYVSPERMKYFREKTNDMPREKLEQLAELLGVEPPPAILQRRVD